MKISQIQSYQPIKVKNNTIRAIKSGTPARCSSPRFFSPLFKLGIFMLTVLGMSSCQELSGNTFATRKLKTAVFTNATNHESEDSTNVSSQEMDAYYDALSYYEQIKNENISYSQLDILAHWIGFYTNLKSEEGIKLTDKEKEQIRFAVYNKIAPEKKTRRSNNDNDFMDDELQRQATHHLLFNNK